MNRRKFVEVDVFGSGEFDGNPLAVIHDADGLSTEQMQRIATWTNFSETTFLSDPEDAGADYRARIFTPHAEIPFAGHPTLGSAHAWLEAGGADGKSARVVQECGIGLVELAVSEEGLIGFAAPPLRSTQPVAAEERQRTLALLGVDPTQIAAMTWLDNGLSWLGVELVDIDVLASLSPSSIDDLPVDVCTFVPRSNYPGTDIELRCFFGQGDLREDPVTGSANASVARHLLSLGKIQAPYVAAQGDHMGRRGRVFVTESDDTVWISGRTRTMVAGTIAT